LEKYKSSINQTIQDNFLIRDFRNKDFDSLVNLWKATGIYGPERKDDKKSIRRCNSFGGKLLVMIDIREKLLMGSSWMTLDGRRLYLHHFCILPDYQGQGLGKMLGYASLEFIKNTGYQTKVEVHKENIPAKKLYEKLGFFSYTNYDIYMKRDV